jgi:hypothetical protein
LTSLSPILGLTDIAPAQAQPNVPINVNARRLEAVIQLTVISIADAPGGTPADGDRYIVAGAPAGAFATFNPGDVAYFGAAAGWQNVTPLPGWLAYVQALGQHFRFGAGSPAGWVLAF